MIELQQLGARMGGFTLSDISFTVPAGKYGVVIGPAGSGKTTLLETIAGINTQRSGVLRLGGVDARELAPERRNIGLVYQHGYLFPHLSVEENIGYGASDRELARTVARRLGATDLAGRDVRSLSGGERQLVAIARALATRPSFLLLDEPFSALDPRRRSLVRREVRAFHREWGLTVLQVTHDFTEAGLLGDLAILLDGGRVLQSGPPEEVFRRPASPYIAEFLGAENVFSGDVHILPGDVQLPRDARISELPPGDKYHAIEFRTGGLTIHTVGDAHEGAGYAVVRAEEVVLSHEAPISSVRNSFMGRIDEMAVLGALTRVTVDVNGTPLIAALTTRSAHDMELREGMRIHASFKALAVHLC